MDGWLSPAQHSTAQHRSIDRPSLSWHCVAYLVAGLLGAEALPQRLLALRRPGVERRRRHGLWCRVGSGVQSQEFKVNPRFHPRLFLLSPTHDLGGEEGLDVGLVLRHQLLARGLEVFPDQRLVLARQPTYRMGRVGRLIGQSLSYSSNRTSDQ